MPWACLSPKLSRKCKCNNFVTWDFVLRVSMILSMLMIYITWPHTSEGNESMLNVLVASEGQICKGTNNKTKSLSFYCLFCLKEQLSLESLYSYNIYDGATLSRIAVRFTQAITKITNFAVCNICSILIKLWLDKFINSN